MKFKRAILVILDSIGVGALKDAKMFGDSLRVNTLKNTASSKKGGLNIPNLERLGLGTLGKFSGVKAKAPTHGMAIKCGEKSNGKDTSTGHWEIAGLVTKKPFQTFPEGFPAEIIDRFIEENNLPGILCNSTASGTQIINELGAEHIESGKPIIYTSADSVFQIACDEDTFGLDRLYEVCESARLICDEYKIARVIARPFIGNKKDGFKRTSNRKDYSIALPGKILFDYLKEENILTHTIGKISNIYNHQSVASNVKSKNNMDGVDKLLSVLEETKDGLIAVNLVDFDQDFGHRRDPLGYANAIEEFDQRLPEILEHVDEESLLLITADHGNDPTAPGTDHTREHVPLLIHSPAIEKASPIKLSPDFLVTGATIYEALTSKKPPFGKSLISKMKIAPMENVTTFNAANIIAKKRDGKKLTKKEMKWFVDGYLKDEIADYQMSALLMAAYIHDLDTEETAAFTTAMLHSGKVLEFNDPTVIDKHSTGGVGDKTSFIVAPIAAAAGVKVPMVSGRGLSHTGGTIDKIESISGFKTDLNLDQFKEQLTKENLVLIGQTSDIAPADKRIYALRDVSGTVSSIPLIASSIMSKKLAEGCSGLVMDVKTGNGAFLKKRADSVKMAKSIMNIAHSFGKRTISLITDMNQPLGNAVGNSLEIIESIETLKGKGPKDLRELSLELSAAMIYLAGICTSLKKSKTLAKKMLDSGEALKKFKKLIEVQGGDVSVLEDYNKIPVAPEKTEVLALDKGYIHNIETEKIGLLCTELGGGRKVSEDTIDHSVGFIFHKKYGQKVKKGEPILSIYHHPHQQSLIELITKELLEKVIKVKDNKPKPRPLIYTTLEK